MQLAKANCIFFDYLQNAAIMSTFIIEAAIICLVFTLTCFSLVGKTMKNLELAKTTALCQFHLFIETPQSPFNPCRRQLPLHRGAN